MRITPGNISDLIKNPEDFNREFVKIYPVKERIPIREDNYNDSLMDLAGIKIEGEEGMRIIYLYEKETMEAIRILKIKNWIEDKVLPLSNSLAKKLEEENEDTIITKILFLKGYYLSNARYLPLISGQSAGFGSTDHGGEGTSHSYGSVKTSLLLYGLLYKPKTQ